MSYATDASVLNVWWNAGQEANTLFMEARKPHVLMRPQIYQDGDAWCCLYGEDIQVGVVGFGRTPAEAAHVFDLAWEGKVLLENSEQSQ